MSPVLKTCSKCGEVKSLAEFHRYKSGRDDRQAHCRICQAEYHRRWREENREKIAERKRRYYEDNREEQLEQSRLYREENRDACLRASMRSKNRIDSTTSLLATKSGRWSNAEIAILIADDGRSVVSKALELGRNYTSCRRKIENLRKAGVVI